MTGGPQSVGKRSTLIVLLSPTITRRLPPVGNQSLTFLRQVFVIPPICTDCWPPVCNLLVTEVGDWSRTISNHWLLKTSENLTQTTENHCTTVPKPSPTNKRLDRTSPLPHDHGDLPTTPRPKLSVTGQRKWVRRSARPSHDCRRLPKTTENLAVMSGRQPVLPPVLLRYYQKFNIGVPVFPYFRLVHTVNTIWRIWFYNMSLTRQKLDFMLFLVAKCSH